VSIFAKQVDKERSVIKFDESEVLYVVLLNRTLTNVKKIQIDLHLSGSKRFSRALSLFGPIDPAGSTSQFYATKVKMHEPFLNPQLSICALQVELQLEKRDTRSWAVLEKTSGGLGNINLTFGVGGRTGTVGAKDVVLDATNQLRA
jgi:hypothetical protein